jgi:PAS domain S-box-containing protein
MTQSEPDPRRASARARRRRTHLERCWDLSLRLLSATSVDDVSRAAVEAVARAWRAAEVVLAILPGADRELSLVHRHPRSRDVLPDGVVWAAAGMALDHGSPVWEVDAHAFLASRGLPPAQSLRNLLAIPLQLGAAPPGAIIAANASPASSLPRYAAEAEELLRPLPYAFSHCWLLESSARELRILEAIQERDDHMLAYVDRTRRFVRANAAFAAAVGVPQEQLVGMTIDEAMPAASSLLAACREALASAGEVSTEEISQLLPQVSEQQASYWNWHVTPVRGLSGEPEGVVVSAQDVTAHVEVREKLIEAERVRTRMAEALNAELNHRIKNNLAMVAGLLRMQLEEAGQEEEGTALIRQAIQRLGALAAVHEQLCDTQVGEVEIVDMIRRVATSAGKTLGGEQVQVSVAGEAVRCHARTATIVSVVTNELVTNALKHGRSYQGGPPVIRVEVGRRGGELHLAVWNSGGLPPGGVPQPGEQLGLRLVQDLVSQCEGHFALTAHQGGVLARVVLEEARLDEGDAGQGGAVS